MKYEIHTIKQWNNTYYLSPF